MRDVIAAAPEAALAEAPVASPVPRGLSLPRLTTRQLALGIGAIGLGFVPLAFGIFGSVVAGYVAVYAMLELSIVVVTGYAGLISLMPFTFVGVGAMTTATAVTVWGWPFWLALPLSAVATVPLSAAVGAVSARLKGLYLAIATLTFSDALGETLFKWKAFTGGQAGHRVARPDLGALSFASDFALYALAILVAVALVWGVHGLKNSRAGRAMLAVRDNEREAQALGINATKTKLTALVIGGMIAGIGGAFYAVLLQRVPPAGFQSPYVQISSLLLVVWAVIGGMDSAYGAFLGATSLIVQLVVFQGAEKLFAITGVYAAVVLVAFLLFRPGGIVQVVKIQAERIREAPGRHIPITVVAFGLNIAFAYLILRYAKGT